MDDILYYVREKKEFGLQFVIALPSQLVPKALELCHDQSGHFGQFKTIRKTESHFYWPTLRVDVIAYLKRCLMCQQYKQTKGLSQKYRELPTIDSPLQRIAIDLTDLTAGHE